MTKNADLPFASTLCGSCSNVCPVKIDIHDQLYKWRQVLASQGYIPKSKEVGIKAMSVVLSQPRFYQWSGRLGRAVMRTVPFVVNNSLNPWFKQREMPEPPRESFRDWYVRNRKN